MTDRPLGDAVRPDLSEARLTRQWSAIERRIRPGSRHRRAIVAALGAVAVVALSAAAALWLPVGTLGPDESVWDGAIVQSAAEPVSVTLKDGSRIDLQRESRLQLVERSPSTVRLRLRAGRAEFDVRPNPARRFSVAAGDLVVQVIGTRFIVTVERAAEHAGVSVAVERGVVEVRGSGRTLRLHAGETWSAPASQPRKATAEPAVPGPAPQPPPEPALEKPAAKSKPAPATEAPPTAREIFEEANRARLSGDLATAADEYRTLLAEHPGDPRAGLAAFELGRLLQDRLGDPGGAARALQRAVSLASGSGFREDAMARLVRAYATLGASDACDKAKRAYLNSFPGGVHTTAVQRACRR